VVNDDEVVVIFVWDGYFVIIVIFKLG